MQKSKEKTEERKAQLIQLTSSFSKEFLNLEYDELIEKLILKMARKRDVPFNSGRIEIWAAAIIHALGTINFLFDKESKPYASISDICQFFDTKQSTTTQKSKKIRDMFKMTYFDDTFSTKSVSQDSPFNDLVFKDGFVIPSEMIKEQEPHELYHLEDWELGIASILGHLHANKQTQYTAEEITSMLEVTAERYFTFYDFLHKNLNFPFSASIKVAIDESTVEEYDIHCLNLHPKIAEKYGLLLECKNGKKTELFPLADIEIEEENNNYPLIDLYQAWYWTYSE